MYFSKIKLEKLKSKLGFGFGVFLNTISTKPMPRITLNIELILDSNMKEMAKKS